MKYRKVTIAQVRSIIKKTGLFNGFIVGNKVHPSHFFEGWACANLVKLNSVEEVNRLKNGAMYYLEKEMGDNIAFYEFT